MNVFSRFLLHSVCVIPTELCVVTEQLFTLVHFFMCADDTVWFIIDNACWAGKVLLLQGVYLALDPFFPFMSRKAWGGGMRGAWMRGEFKWIRYH